jgi:hypothetical protein
MLATVSGHLQIAFWLHEAAVCCGGITIIDTDSQSNTILLI